MNRQMEIGEQRKERFRRNYNRFTDPETCENVLNKLRGHKQQGEIVCPHCQSHDVIGHGKYRDRQRYKCKCCSKTFNDFTSTPLHGTHYPHKWVKFLECMIKGESLRTAEIKVKVPYVTPVLLAAQNNWGPCPNRISNNREFTVIKDSPFPTRHHISTAYTIPIQPYDPTQFYNST
ncbi:IS1 family transposase [Effusibacillus lacus]|uniref:Transposase n=1 Tax=Effusibacillus lacus TaxID=1348429 RepID=A0A292YKE7_9BACL|nr:IS1 family transposase [Effusibacillus lacus]TCS69771.1 hypothetical protein EDD64_1352 [Effusibacillus lacus]GAX88854.1 transposase [Effusibacillus lacus]